MPAGSDAHKADAVFERYMVKERTDRMNEELVAKRRPGGAEHSPTLL